MKHLFLLDPGHGGIINGEYQTKGKRSPKWEDGRQLLEGVFNRSIAKRLKKWAPLLDIECINLVPEQTDISRKIRTEKANRLMEKNLDRKCVYVSIHANAGGGKGIEVFTSPGLTEADAIATVFIKKFAQSFPMITIRTDMTDGDPDKEAEFFVLKNTIMPAILIESFFMDNEYECKMYLLSEEGRNSIALVYLAAMVELEKEGC